MRAAAPSYVVIKGVELVDWAATVDEETTLWVTMLPVITFTVASLVVVGLTAEAVVVLTLVVSVVSTVSVTGVTSVVAVSRDKGQNVVYTDTMSLMVVVLRATPVVTGLAVQALLEHEVMVTTVVET